MQLLQRGDGLSRLSVAESVPVRKELIAVQIAPFEQHGEPCRRKTASHAIPGDLDGDGMFAVLRVKVRPRVFVEEHPDHNSKKTADLGHAAQLPEAGLVTVIRRLRVVSFGCNYAIVQRLRRPIDPVRPDDRRLAQRDFGKACGLPG